MGMRWQVLGLLLAWVTIAVLTGVQAAEHPSAEHPSAEKATQGSATKAKLTKEELAKEIEAYVKADAKLKGGYFLVFDKMAKKPLVLTLERVHKDRLSRVKEGVYFACADFRSIDGHLYDLDVFMKQGEMGLKAIEISVHKVDGQPRYTWMEKDGLWMKQEVKGSEPMGSASKEEGKGSGTK